MREDEIRKRLEQALRRLLDRQQEREHLIATIAAARAVDQICMDRGAIEARVQAQVASWRELLTESVEGGRTLLRDECCQVRSCSHPTARATTSALELRRAN